jgi:CRP/FNR family transcriptional regulator, cyclic AMP receptor protein
VAVQSSEPGTFLALLADGDRGALLTRGGVRRFARGECLMHAGEPGDRVLILLRGHVKASSVDSRGREMVLSFRGPGDVLGELTFSHADPRSSNVTAIEPVEARAIAASEFRDYLLQRPTAALTLIDVIGQRFRDANSKRVQFGDLDTVGRVAARLLELCERYGERTDTGIQVRLPVTQEDLGSWTASSRAGVAAALRTMRDLGWITTDRRRIVVLDLDALTRRAA